MTDKKQSTSDGSRSGSRYDGSRIASSRYDGSRYDGSRYDGARFDGTRFDGTRFEERSTMTEVLIQTLTGGRLRPALSTTPAGRRARFGRIAGGLATAAVLAAFGFAVVPRLFEPPIAPEPMAVLEIARGSMGVVLASARQSSSRRLTLAQGEPIHAGTVIETAAASGTTGGPGRAALRLASGPSVRLDHDTRLEVRSDSSLWLVRGAVYVDSAAGSAVEVRTTLGVVRDIGTQFEVRILGADDEGGEEPPQAEGTEEGPLRVRVREGLVILQTQEQSHEAGAGVELVMRSDGALVRGTVPIYGSHWDWVLETAPMPDLEGRPLSAFLDWVTREGGWTVRFDDDETARDASTIILHGDVEDLTLAEAASMVLQGSGLAYRVEEGAFVVEAAGAAAAGRRDGWR